MDEQKRINDAKVEFFVAFGEFIQSLTPKEWGVVTDNGIEIALPEGTRLVVLDRAKNAIAGKCARNWKIKEIQKVRTV